MSLRFLSEVISPSTTFFSLFFVQSNLNDNKYSVYEEIRVRHVFDVLFAGGVIGFLFCQYFVNVTVM